MTSSNYTSRRAAAAYAASKNQRPKMGDQFTRPKDILFLREGAVETLVVFPGNYGPEKNEFGFLHYLGWAPSAIRAYDPMSDKRGARIVCNCHGGQRLGADGQVVPCVPCLDDADYRRSNPDKKRKFIPFDYYAVNAIHFGDYHQVKTSGGSSYRTLCKKATDPKAACKYCEKNDPKVGWKHVHLDLDRAQYDTLLGYDLEIHRKCRACNTGVAAPVSARCTTCGKKVEATREMLAVMEVDAVVCPLCRARTVMSLEYACTRIDQRTKQATAGCGNLVTWGIDECDIDVMMEKVKSVSIIRMLDYRPSAIDSADAEEIWAEMQKPFDFSFYDQISTKEQAALLGIPDPYA